MYHIILISKNLLSFLKKNVITINKNHNTYNLKIDENNVCNILKNKMFSV